VLFATAPPRYFHEDTDKTLLFDILVRVIKTANSPDKAALKRAMVHNPYTARS